MNIVKFLIALVLTAGLTYLLNTPNPLGTEQVPALGKLLSPFEGFWRNAKSESKSSYKNRSLEGLMSDVQIVYDERLVPHIFAENLTDAYFAQGYVMAQHRLWQMDISTRAASGRLSEVLGKRTLEFDKLQRRKGLLYAAEKTVQSWRTNEEGFSYIQAYVEGVNSYVRSMGVADVPVEFKLLGYKPELWTPVKTALFVISMAETLNFGNNDLQTTNALQALGEETFRILYPEQNPKQSPVIPAGTKWDFLPDTAAVQAVGDTMLSFFGDYIYHSVLPMAPLGIGSNNWAVAGSKTASGAPILCNDPHLTLSLPSIWFQIQLQTPQVNVYGVALPGIPGVIIGFNENIAWGVTNVGQDVLDWYRIEWADDKKTAYKLDGEIRQATLVPEEIKVRGHASVIDTVKYTHFGPVVYESDTFPYHDMAMRWLTHDAPNPEEMSAFGKLNAAKNYDDYSEALKLYDRPAQNFVFASKDGDIALKVNGKLPIKRHEQGRFVQEGNTTKNDWQGFIPKEQVAQVKNPERAFVSSANQHSTDETYPYYYNARGFDDYRGRYINRRLEEMTNITVEDMMALQNSNYSIFPEEALPTLLANLNRSKLNPVQEGLVKLLEGWNYQFNGEDIAPALFEEWWKQFYDMAWDEIHALNEKQPTLFPENWRTLELLQTDPLNVFWDVDSTAQREMPQDIVTNAFIAMEKSLHDVLQTEGYNWQQYKSTFIGHLGRIEPFSRYNLAVGGYGQAPNAIQKTTGPSWRMVVELGNPIKAYGVYPGGQSGNPGSRFYDNMIDKWVAGEYDELFFMQDAQDKRQSVLFTQTLKAK